jgi:hypothetical protein
MKSHEVKTKNQLFTMVSPTERLEEALSIMAKVKQRADLRNTWQRFVSTSDSLINGFF